MGSAITYTARAGFFATGIATAMMGAYHLYLPTHMQWDAGLDGVPGMIRWGVLAINSDFSFLLMFMGLLACVQAIGSPPRSASERISIYMLAAFWLWHQIYLRTHAMPIPDSLSTLRAALETFGIVILVGAAICPTVLIVKSQESLHVKKRWILASGLLAGSVAMGVVVAVVLWSMPTMKASSQADTPKMAIDPAETDADRLGVASLADLSPSTSFRVFKQATSVTDEQYLSAWPRLGEELARAEQIDPASEDAALLNAHARFLMRSGDLAAANRVINRAIELDSEHALHHLQAGMIGIGLMDAEQSPMKRWSLSTQTLTAMEAALRLDPSLLAARLYLVYSLELAPPGFGGDRERAMELLDEAIESGTAEFIPVRARFRFGRGEYQAGLADARQAIAEGVYHPGTFTLASTQALEAGDSEDAFRFASFAVRMEPDNTENWRALAVVLASQGDQARADSVEEFIQEATK